MRSLRSYMSAYVDVADWYPAAHLRLVEELYQSAESYDNEVRLTVTVIGFGYVLLRGAGPGGALQLWCRV